MLGRKVIFVRCINCAYNNVTNGIRLLDKNKHFCLYRKNFMQVTAFESYPLKEETIAITVIGFTTRHADCRLFTCQYVSQCPKNAYKCERR